jgi:hypothetical protein
LSGVASICASARGVGADAVGVGVTVGRIRVGVAIGDGVKLGINVGVIVGGSDVGVFDDVAGNSDRVSLDVGSAASTFGLGPGVDMLVAVDVGEAISISGEMVTFDGLHAVKANTIIKPQRSNSFIKHLIPFILRPYFFSRIQN